MHPKVSFITGVKNRSKELAEMLKTLIDQDMQEWEAIVVEDHCKENIKAVTENFNDERIKFFQLPENITGISNARNFAIKHSNTDYILIADSDDLNEPFRARLTYNIMKRNHCDVFYGNIRYYTPEKVSRGVRFQPFNEELLRMINFISNPAAAFRKRKFIELGKYDPIFTISEDYDLWLRFLNNKAKFCYTKRVLVNYRYDRKSISKQKAHLLEKYISMTRAKNKIEPFDIFKIKEIAKPSISKTFLSKKNKRFWIDYRFKAPVE